MKITFLGAAKTVTGSCYLIEACGIMFTVDCGMFQGNSIIEKRNFEIQHYHAKELQFILLTHAHIDHSGLLPKIVKEGFHGRIYCTAPTKDLATLMLEDSAHINEMEAQWKNKKYARHGKIEKEVLPLYTVEEAQNVSPLFTPVSYNTMFEPHPGIQVTYHDAGHILGAAFLELVIKEEGKEVRLVFSGDLGRTDSLLMHEPMTPPQADFLFIESTYGDRNHKIDQATFDELVDAIHYSWTHNSKTIIPAFAVGRTQEILYCLYLLKQQNRIPDIPIFLDSPLAIQTTKIFETYNSYLKFNDHPSFKTILDGLSVKYTPSVKESKEINELKGSAIIISASGMCNAGRIKHHLFNNAWKTGVSIVFVGYQAVGTLGRKIVDGAKTVRIFGEDVAIKAKVYTLGGFSAHAGQQQLLGWIGRMYQPQMEVLLVHGEEKAQEVFSKLIQQKYGLTVYIPSYLEQLELTAESQKVIVSESKNVQPVEWSKLTDTIKNNFNNINLKLKNIAQQPWETQICMYDRLVELNQEIESFLNYNK